MRRTTGRIMIVVAALAAGPGPAASADLVEYDGDFEAWEAAVGAYTTLDFTGIPDGTYVTEQYADLGVHFVDGTDIVRCCDIRYFPRDGAGLDGNEFVRLTFDEPITAFATHYNNFLEYTLYFDGAMVAESSTFWLGGSYNGAFAGVTSSEPFNEVLITQQSTHFPNVHLDDIHFGPPIPSAPAIALLAGGALLTRRRRG